MKLVMQSKFHRNVFVVGMSVCGGNPLTPHPGRLSQGGFSTNEPQQPLLPSEGSPQGQVGSGKGEQSTEQSWVPSASGAAATGCSLTDNSVLVVLYFAYILIIFVHIRRLNLYCACLSFRTFGSVGIPFTHLSH